MDQPCAHHSMLTAVGECHTCRRPFCDLCLMEIADAHYCSGECFKNRSSGDRRASPTRTPASPDPLDGLEFTEMDDPSSGVLPRTAAAAAPAPAPSAPAAPSASPGTGDWVPPWEAAQESSAAVPVARHSPPAGREESVILGREHLLGDVSDSSILEMPRRPGPISSVFETPVARSVPGPSESPESDASVYLSPPPGGPSTAAGNGGSGGASPRVAACIRHPEVQALGTCEYCSHLLCALCAEERPEGWVCFPACPESGTMIRKVPAVKKRVSPALLAVGLVGPLFAAGMTFYLYQESRTWAKAPIPQAPLSSPAAAEAKLPGLAQNGPAPASAIPGIRPSGMDLRERPSSFRSPPKAERTEPAPEVRPEESKPESRLPESRGPRASVAGDPAKREPRREERPSAPAAPPAVRPAPAPAAPAAAEAARPAARGSDSKPAAPKSETPQARPPELSPLERDLREAARLVQEARPLYEDVTERTKTAFFQPDDVPALLERIESVEQKLDQARAIYGRLRGESPPVPGLDAKIEKLGDLRKSLGEAVERLRVPRTLLHAQEQIRQATPLYKKVATQWANLAGTQEDRSTLLRETEQAITMLWDARTLYESVLEEAPNRATLLRRIRVIDGLIRDLEHPFSASKEGR